MMQNLAIDNFNKPLKDLTEDEIMQIEEMMDEMSGKRKAPSIKMASETPEEEFDMMMESEILGEFDEYKKNNPGKTFDDFMKIKSMQMSEAPDDTKTILKLMEDNNMSFEEASNFLRIEKSRKNKPKEPVEPKKIKLAEGGLSYLMGM